MSTSDSSAAWRGAVRLAEADATPGAYYVTARNQRGQTAFLVGPFLQRRPGKNAHARALAAVRAARRAVHELYPSEAPWLMFGTSRVPFSHGLETPAGKINAHVGAYAPRVTS